MLYIGNIGHGRLAIVETETLAPSIRHLIKSYEDYLDIVERPSVGSLAVPIDTTNLIIEVLKHSFFSFMVRCRPNVKVKVKCARTTPTTLTLEVMADSAKPPLDEMRESFRLSELNQRAEDLDGEIITGGELFSDDRPALYVFYRLVVPIPA